MNFKKLGITGQSPYIEEFSKVIEIGDSTCVLNFNIFEGYFETGNISVNFVQEELLLQHSGAVLVIAGNCLAVMHYNKKYFFFDSHSRDSEGHQVEGSIGTSVLLKFDNLQEIKQYVRSEYKNTNLFNIIYLKTDFDNQENIKYIISGQALRRRKNISHKRSVEKMKSTEQYKDLLQKQSIANKRSREKIQGTDKHEQEKELKRKRRELNRGTENHEQEKEKKRKAKKSAYIKNKKLKSGKRVDNFRQKKIEGPSYICVTCNRSMFKRSVIIFDEQKYSKINFEEIENFNPVTTFDGNFYVCTTCHRKLIKGEIPCQSVSNKLQIFDLPDHLSDIRKLERILVAQRILFSKVRIMHKGEFPKLQGAICNV
eukprot:TCONS_00044307-protein